MKNINIRDLLLRYLILILVAIPNLWIFYFVFTPLTIYPVYLLLKIFFNTNLVGNFIIVNGTVPIELIKACIAGSAYYLLLILNLSVPKIKLPKRLKMIAFSFSILLGINIARIFLLSIILVKGFSFFDITHIVFWYALSIVFVVGIWFLTVKKFKIKDIPFYSDIKTLYQNSHLMSAHKRHNTKSS